LDEVGVLHLPGRAINVPSGRTNANNGAIPSLIALDSSRLGLCRQYVSARPVRRVWPPRVPL